MRYNASEVESTLITTDANGWAIYRLALVGRQYDTIRIQHAKGFGPGAAGLAVIETWRQSGWVRLMAVKASVIDSAVLEATKVLFA